jgi:predicted alpha/beta hydrolase family esterase
MSKPQVIFIHGGDAFRDTEKLYALLRERSFNPYEERKYWRDAVAKNLLETHECHALSMPNKYWADYTAWKIWFEKMIPFLRDNVTLVGHSLGGAFLFRYLSEERLPITLTQVHLVAPVIEYLADCDGFLVDTQTWSGFKTPIAALHLWHSEDDSIVPISHSERVCELSPNAVLHRYTDRFHFIGDDFPELTKVIQNV